MPTEMNLADTSAAASATFTLSRNPFGRLTLHRGDGTSYEGVVPVRAFPISAPQGGIGMMSADGHEVVWIPRLEALPAAERGMIEEELASREFMPEIGRIVEVSTFATPSVWTVQTDRGQTRLVLRGEEAIRRLSGNTLLVSDSHGIHYLIRDLTALDKHSRKLLDRFL